MVPVHNRTAHLRQCLESVLAASIPRERMQIAVVDDSTANPNVEEEVRAIAGARVEFHHNEQNLGMAGNWNRCIAVARGALVHILHDDDYVSPGFYPGMEALAAKFPQASIYFSRVLQVDDGGSINWVSPRLKSFEEYSSEAGPLFYRCEVRFPGVVVRREAYGRVGGFDATMRMTLDWDMWMRLIADGGAASVDTPLAFYRRHEDAATSRYFRDGTYFREMLRIRDVFAARHPAFRRVEFNGRLESEFRNYLSACRESRDDDALSANLSIWRELVPWHRRIRYLVRTGGELLFRTLRV
jgi:GT2 family glycosyltransferase